MPTDQYIPKERYFFIASAQVLDMILPIEVCDKLGYEEVITLGEVAIFQELDNGNYVVSVQLSPNPLLESKCVYGFITEEDFNQAKEYYSQNGITEFLTIEEYKQLMDNQLYI